MSLLAWIVLGFCSGFIGSKVIDRTGKGFALDIVLGIGGAVLGGWIFAILGTGDVGGVNFYSLGVAIVGAISVLATYHLLARSAAR